MKEIPLHRLVYTLSARRLANAAAALSAFLLSAVTRRPLAWGRPMILTVEPTNVCNLSCPLCVTGNGRMTRPKGTMSFSTFKNLIDEIGDYLFYLLLYQQGEPFINRDFIRFIQYAKVKRIFVTTSTNGHYLDSDTAERTVDSGLDSIIVSIDGADQATYERYRVDGKLSKVLAGIENLVRAKIRAGTSTPFVYVQFIVMKQNQHQIAEMKKLTQDVGADKFLQKTVHVETLAEAREWLPADDAWRRYRIEPNKLTPKRRGIGPCLRPWTSSLVNWDGVVVPCCFDKNAGHPVGAVKQDPFDEIWHSKSYDDFRFKMLNHRADLDICANCSQGLRLFV